MDERTWRARQRAHRERVEPWIRPRLARRASGDAHPTDDFLFEYYPFSPAKLRAWHPGYGEVLEGDADEFLVHDAYVRTGAGVTVDIAQLQPRRQRLALAIRILDGVSNREPVTGCFALHEWAMVYGLQQEEVRHSRLPLRLTPERIRRTVDDIGLRCTHIDAYRFFTAEATPLNAHVPTRATQPDLEQRGCLHANMDLYKYASWFAPFVSSDLVADAFELARLARNLDMQASPYDVSHLGLESIKVETPEGRRQFAAEQRHVLERAEPLRARLTDALHRLADELDNVS